MQRPVSTTLLAGAVLAGGGAHANRPLNTDTADTIAAGRCQFEPYAGRSHDSTARERWWALQVNCGVADNSQLGAGFSGAGDDAAAERRLALGGKTALRPLSDGQTGLSVGYGLGATRPSGGSWSAESAAFYGIATREWVDGWLTHANLGWSRSRSAHQSSTTWAVATEYTVRPGIVLSGEAYGDDRSRPWTAAGVLWQVQPGASVNASYGVQHEHERVRQWTLGFLIEF